MWNGRVCNGKIWTMSRCTLKYLQYYSGRAVEKNGYGKLTCHVFSVEDAVAHLNTSHLDGSLTIKK